MEKISVIIPMYNSSKYIDRCISSLKQQTYNNIEFILSDDGSSDDTLSIANRLCLGDSRFQIDSHKNLGPGPTRDLCMWNCDSDYIGFVDADDWIEPCMFEKMISIARQYDTDVVRCNTKIHKKDMEYTRWSPAELTNKLLSSKDIKSKIIPLLIGPENEKDYNQRLLRGCVSCIFKRTLIFSNNIHFGSLRSGEDVLFVIECLSKANTMFIDDEPYYHYMFENSNSLTKSSFANNSVQRFELRDSIIKLVSNFSSYDIIKKRFDQEERRLVFLDCRICVLYSHGSFKNKFNALKHVVSSDNCIRAFKKKINIHLPFQMFVLYFLIKYKLSFLLYIALIVKFRKEAKYV